MNSKIRSPFFYVGDKYKLMPQLLKIFPRKIKTYYEPFVGGGSSFLNINADKYVLNDIDTNIINLHKMLIEYSKSNEDFIKKIYDIIENYNLSCSYLNKNVPEELKKELKKTYYAKYNKENYIKLREDYIKDKELEKLYILLIYGFNHMLRFNKNGIFNLPVGNVDFNKNVYNSLKYYFEFVYDKKIKLCNMDYIDFVKNIDFKEGDFIYFDPPYLISSSEYNKLWNEDKENELYNLLDKLNEKGVKFAITNLVNHKNKINEVLLNWMKKYNVYDINSNYISRFDNSIKENSREVCVTNYG